MENVIFTIVTIVTIGTFLVLLDFEINKYKI